MKKHIIFLVFVLVLMNKTGYCDVIEINTHYVDKCVKITNIDDYPEVSLLGFIPPSAAPYDTYVINSIDCLTKGYKYNNFNIYAVKKEYLIGKDIKKIDLPRDPNASPNNIHIELYGGYINDSISISSIEQYYKIVGYTTTSVVLYKWKEVNKFNNGKPDSTSTYTYQGDSSQLYQKIQTSINSNQYQSSIELYPNPAQKIVHLKINNTYQGKVTLEMTNIGGRTIKFLNLVKTGLILDYDIPIGNLAKEAYLVNIKFGNRVESRKIVIK